MKRRVVFTGAGLSSVAGDSPRALHQALCSAASFLKPVEGFELHSLTGAKAMEIGSFHPRDYLGDQNFRPLDRTCRLAVVAADLALKATGWQPERIGEEEVGLFLGTVFCGLRTIMEFDRGNITKGPKYAKPMDFANTVINAAAGQTALWHDLRGVNSTVASGGTSGLMAVMLGADAIRTGQADALLAGGAEELCFESLYTFFRTGMLAGSDGEGCQIARPFDANRNGFNLGEGAGFVMLEELDSARSRGATLLAELKAGAQGFDPSRGQDSEQAARAMAQTVERVLKSSGLCPEDIDGVCASASGSPVLDTCEALALRAIFGERMPPLTAPKGVLGETLGAAGAFLMIAVLESMATGRWPGVAHLGKLLPELPSGSLDGHPREGDFRNTLITITGYDGGCAALVIGRMGETNR